MTINLTTNEFKEFALTMTRCGCADLDYEKFLTNLEKGKSEKYVWGTVMENQENGFTVTLNETYSVKFINRFGTKFGSISTPIIAACKALKPLVEDFIKVAKEFSEEMHDLFATPRKRVVKYGTIDGTNLIACYAIRSTQIDIPIPIFWSVTGKNHFNHFNADLIRSAYDELTVVASDAEYSKADRENGEHISDAMRCLLKSIETHGIDGTISSIDSLDRKDRESIESIAAALAAKMD